MYPDLTIKPRSVSAFCWQIHPLLAVQVPPLRVWVHCPRASNGLLPRRSNLVGYVRWDERSDQSSFQTIDSNSFTRSQPSRVLGDHLKDQIPDLLGHGLSSHLPAHPGDQTPVQTETSTMPADHGLGSDYQESLLPGGPEAARENPEEPVQKAKPGPGMSALQNSQLLSKR